MNANLDITIGHSTILGRIWSATSNGELVATGHGADRAAAIVSAEAFAARTRRAVGSITVRGNRGFGS